MDHERPAASLFDGVEPQPPAQGEPPSSLIATEGEVRARGFVELRGDAFAAPIELTRVRVHHDSARAPLQGKALSMTGSGHRPANARSGGAAFRPRSAPAPLRAL